MRIKNYPRYFIFALFAGLSFCSSQSIAAIPIAKISSFKGEVIIQADTKFRKVTQIGQELNDGDRIQTKQGEAQITFNDGAVMKVRPFTNASIREGEEESGFWVFKTKKPVRRVTCFVGKLWLKSGFLNPDNLLIK